MGFSVGTEGPFSTGKPPLDTEKNSVKGGLFLQSRPERL